MIYSAWNIILWLTIELYAKHCVRCFLIVFSMISCITDYTTISHMYIYAHFKSQIIFVAVVCLGAIYKSMRAQKIYLLRFHVFCKQFTVICSVVFYFTALQSLLVSVGVGFYCCFCYFSIVGAGCWSTRGIVFMRTNRFSANDSNATGSILNTVGITNWPIIKQFCLCLRNYSVIM